MGHGRISLEEFKRRVNELGVRNGNKELREFRNVFTDPELASEFSELEHYLNRIYAYYDEKIDEAFDLPKLRKDFAELDTEKQTFVVLCIISLAGQTHWFSWDVLCYVYKRICKFLESKDGESAMAKMKDIVQDCRLLASNFGIVLKEDAKQVWLLMATYQVTKPNQFLVRARSLNRAIEVLQMTTSAAPAIASPQAIDAICGFVQDFRSWYKKSIPPTS